MSDARFFSKAEIIARTPVWIALSDLYLDTDISGEYSAVAFVCAQSPFSLDELREILVYEVNPVVSPNLYSMAGVWDGFDEQWLIAEICRKTQTKPVNIFSKIRSFLGCFSYAARQWRVLESMITKQRANT